MDPLNIHHVIRHRLSRIETNNFQDKSGCSINGIRSFLFEQGMVQDLDDIEVLIHKYGIQDYRGYPIYLCIKNSRLTLLNDEILRMKNVRFYFESRPPIHKLVSPEPHFVEEEKNLIENHFSYLGSSYNSDDIEEWECFEMDCEGHLVSLKSYFNSTFYLSNESIEHLSNFHYLRNLFISIDKNEQITNFSLLTNLRSLSLTCKKEFEDLELLKYLGLFSNLLSLNIFADSRGYLFLFLLSVLW